MGRNSKERQRIKRLRKKKELRRRRGVSPIVQLAGRSEPVKAIVNDDQDEYGKASIYVLLKTPQGHAMVSFLVDTWCLGLKDAFTELSMSVHDFEVTLPERGRDNGVEMISIEIPAVRRLVAGGIRFARENGFRLPRHYERAVALLGGIEETDIANADLSGFRRDGKLYWIGSMRELATRLVACSAEEFIARPDVQYICELGGAYGIGDEPEWEEIDGDDDDDDFDDDEDGRYDDENDDDYSFEEIFPKIIDRVARNLMDAIRRWCFANNQIPHSQLELATKFMLIETLAVEAKPDKDGLLPHQYIISKMIENDPNLAQSLDAAILQVKEFMQTMPRDGFDKLLIPDGTDFDD